MQKDKGLVSAKEVAKAINIDKLGFLGTFGGWTLMKLLRLTKLNRIYNRTKHLQGLDFLNKLLIDEFEIKFEIPAERSEERRVGKECRSRWSPYH